MGSYTKTVWKDRVVEKPLTFTFQDNGDGTTTLVPAEGTITDPGTPITAEALNNLEKQYDQATTPGAWTNVEFKNSYRNWGGSYPPVQYRVLPNGDIQLRGACCSVGILEPAVMFTLPITVRPAYDFNFGATDNKWNRVNVKISTNGDVTIPNSGATYDVDTAYLNFGLVTIPKD